MSTWEVVDALAESANGHDLMVMPQLDLAGASVTGPQIVAYVFPRSAGGYEVNLWWGDSFDAFEVVQGIPDLNAAARYAVENALCRKPSRVRKKVRSWETAPESVRRGR